MHMQGVHEVLVKCITIVFIVQIHFFTWCARSTKHIYSPLSWMQWVYFINSDICWLFSQLVTAAPQSERRARFCQILHILCDKMAVITVYYANWPGQQSWSIAREPQTAVSPLLGLVSVTCWWIILDDWLFLYPPQVKTLVISTETDRSYQSKCDCAP